jgi:hypothetical protein
VKAKHPRSLINLPKRQTKMLGDLKGLRVGIALSKHGVFGFVPEVLHDALHALAQATRGG